MASNIPSKLIRDLREELSSVIASYKSYDVPSICTRIGLSGGTEQEAFQSKFKYARKRVVGLPLGQLLECAKQIHSEEGSFALGECIAKIADEKTSSITKLGCGLNCTTA